MGELGKWGELGESKSVNWVNGVILVCGSNSGKGVNWVTEVIGVKGVNWVNGVILVYGLNWEDGVNVVNVVG